MLNVKVMVRNPMPEKVSKDSSFEDTMMLLEMMKEKQQKENKKKKVSSSSFGSLSTCCS